MDKSDCILWCVVFIVTFIIAYPLMKLFLDDFFFRSKPKKKKKSKWQTGVPTEEGDYIAHIRYRDADDVFVDYEEVYDLENLLRMIEQSDANFKALAWMKYEPYKEKEDDR